MTKNTFYITTPIYYVNDKPHIGHAYTSIAADVIARFKRLDNFDVFFLTGTDEHGQKVAQSAKKQDKDPKEFVDVLVEHFKELNQIMNISNDCFIRTTEERHVKTVQKVWEQLQSRQEIYKGSYAGWYSVRDEAFYSESELVDGKAPTGAEVEWIEEESYFFTLSKWQDKLLEFYAKNPDFVGPKERYNEVISFVKSGLEDLSVSRIKLTWGVKVPSDSAHTVYVWLDALFNYITAVEGTNYWPCDLHLVGKDIVRFHAVYWPAFLMALDLPLPKRVFAHGWWLNEGEKISKSLGNVIDPITLSKEVGVDNLRFYMIREVPFGHDGNYSQASFNARINAELANNIGNLTQRVVAFAAKNCGGSVPTPSKFLDVDNELLQEAHSAIEKIRLLIDKQALHLAAGEVVALATLGNIYIDHQTPWTYAKTDQERMHTIIYVLLELIRVIGILLLPFVPDSAQKILDIFSIEKADFASLTIKLESGKVLKQGEIIFPRVEGQ